MNYLDLYSLLSDKFGGVSTNVFNTIASYIGTNSGLPDNSLHLMDLSITTQTILLELNMRPFHHINMLKETPNVVRNMAQALTERATTLPIRWLKTIKSKLFEVNRVDDTFVPVELSFSELNCMNSSMNFVFVRGTEVYNFLMFANGKLQIPGVRDMFKYSKHMHFMHCMFKVYTLLFNSPISVMTEQNVMCNFLCRMNMLPEYRVNLVSFTFGISQNIDTFRQ